MRKDVFMRQTISFGSTKRPNEIEDRLIHQDLFSCVDFPTSNFIDLAIIDPLVQPEQEIWGTAKFSKISSESYEDWLDSMDNEVERGVCPKTA